MARNVFGLEFGSAARLSKRPGSAWNSLWGHTMKRSPGINRKSRVLYPGPGFLSSATWPSLPKKHYNGLINNQSMYHFFSKTIDDIRPKAISGKSYQGLVHRHIVCPQTHARRP